GGPVRHGGAVQRFEPASRTLWLWLQIRQLSSTAIFLRTATTNRSVARTTTLGSRLAPTRGEHVCRYQEIALRERGGCQRMHHRWRRGRNHPGKGDGGARYRSLSAGEWRIR